MVQGFLAKTQVKEGAESGWSELAGAKPNQEGGC